MTYPVSSSAMGIAIETVRGTPVQPVYWAKTKALKYKPNVSILEDDTLQGSMVQTYDASVGMRYDSHGWDSFPYLDTLPVFVRAELGSADTVATKPTNTTLAGSAAVGDMSISSHGTIAANSWIVIGTGANQETHYTTTLTGTADPFTVGLQYPILYAHTAGATDGSAAIAGLTGHQYSLLNNGTDNQPPSLTLTDFDGEQWRQLAAAQQDKLTFKFMPNKLAEMSVSYFANPSVTPSPPTASYSTAQAAPAWTVAVSLGGTQIKYMESIELDFGRGVKPIEAFQGTQGYYQYFAGALTATGKITVIEQSGASQLTQYQTGVQQSLDVTFSDRKSGFGFRYHTTNAMFKTGELVRGKEWVEASLDIMMLPTATDATSGGVSPGVFSIGNATTTSI